MSIFCGWSALAGWKDGGREEKLRLILEQEYGVRPVECERPLRYAVLGERREDGVRVRRVGMYYGELEMIFHLYTPVADNGALRAFVMPLHPSAEEGKDLFGNPSSVADYCPVKEVTARRFGVALLSCKTVASDCKGGEYTGIFKAINKPRTATCWGVLSAWAWACGKIYDYLSGTGEFDGAHIAVIGHSRGGKTALLAGATDRRFCLSVSNNSGNSGAALSRGNTGETIADITRNFPHWFCEKYRQYAGNENALPFDQHLLLALQAPRRCYVASASDDRWADPDGELLACRLASPFYGLYGKRGVVVPDCVEQDVAYTQGNIAYHRRTGGHSITRWDWARYMDYFDGIE